MKMARFALVSAAALMATSIAASANEQPTAEELAKVKETLAAWGCEGGDIEKESEGTGVFEVDDAKCKDGQQYDIKLDRGFKFLSMTRD